MKENNIKVGKNTLLKFRKKYGLDGKRINKPNNNKVMKEEQTNKEVKDTNKSVFNKIYSTLKENKGYNTIEDETMSKNVLIGYIINKNRINKNRINKRLKMLSAA